MFAQKLSPEKANKLLKNQGFVVIKHDLQTSEFVNKVKGASLKDGKLVATNKGFEVIHGKDKDVLINAVSTVTVKYPDGKSITRSCGCEGGGVYSARLLSLSRRHKCSRAGVPSAVMGRGEIKQNITCSGRVASRVQADVKLERHGISGPRSGPDNSRNERFSGF